MVLRGFNLQVRAADGYVVHDAMGNEVQVLCANKKVQPVKEANPSCNKSFSVKFEFYVVGNVEKG